MPSPRLPSIKLTIKFCSVAVAIAAIVFAQLGPGDWQVRTGLGWQTEHALAYFVVTLMPCLVWSRPCEVGPAFMVPSVLCPSGPAASGPAIRIITAPTPRLARPQ